MTPTSGRALIAASLAVALSLPAVAPAQGGPARPHAPAGAAGPHAGMGQATTIEGWDAFADGVKALAPRMLAKLPPSMQADPQVRQEVGRLILESLAAYTIGAVSADRDRPLFLPFLNQTLNIGQPNADTTYRAAQITPGGSYRLRGRKGSLRLVKIGELGPGPAETGKTTIVTMGYHDLNALKADADGRYDVLLSPARPAGYTGDWWKLDPRASTLLLRMVSADWAHERDPTIAIERIDAPATRPRPPAADLAARLAALPGMAFGMAQLLVDHVAGLQRDGYVNRLKIFDVSQMGALEGQFYYEGAYDLAEDEALLIEAKVPAHCAYYSMILTNEIYETTDWYNNHSSLNDAQLHVDADGVLRVVVSRRDPGVANWLDTAGYPRGVVQGRWTECSAQPIPSARKLKLADVRAALPKDTKLVDAKARERIVRDRRADLQQRPLW